MGEVLFTIIVAALAFAATHLDDLLVLTGTLATGRVSLRNAIRGQVVGTGALMAVSLAAALGTILIPPGWHHWLGLLPIAVGFRQLYGSAKSRLTEEPATKGGQAGNPTSSEPANRSGMFLIAMLAVANGGDNVAVYTALFNVQTFVMSGITILVGLGLAALWAGLAGALVNHPRIGKPIRRVAPWVLPWVLIALGVLILLPDR